SPDVCLPRKINHLLPRQPRRRDAKPLKNPSIASSRPSPSPINPSPQIQAPAAANSPKAPKPNRTCPAKRREPSDDPCLPNEPQGHESPATNHRPHCPACSPECNAV